MTTSRFPLGSRARQRAALLLEAIAGANPYMVARARAELATMRQTGGPAEARRLGLELALARARDGKDPLKGHNLPADTCGMVELPPQPKEQHMTTALHKVYDVDGDETGTIEVRDDGSFVVHDTAGRQLGRLESFNKALDLIDGFRWEVQHPTDCGNPTCDEQVDRVAKALEIPDDPFADLPGNLGR